MEKKNHVQQTQNFKLANVKNQAQIDKKNILSNSKYFVKIGVLVNFIVQELKFCKFLSFWL